MDKLFRLLCIASNHIQRCFSIFTVELVIERKEEGESVISIQTPHKFLKKTVFCFISSCLLENLRGA